MSDELVVTFGRPTIAPKVYIVKGPSGWPETFRRDIADRSLIAFVQPAPVDQLVDVFMRHREVNPGPTDWFTIVGFLSRTMGVSPKMIPHEAGVAFWAQIVSSSISKRLN